MNDPLTNLPRWAHEYGDITHFKIFRQSVYLLNNPDYIEEVLVTQNRNFMKSRALRESTLVLGQGLLTSEGDFWRRQRRLAQPAFHRNRINAYGQTMVDYAQRTVSQWKDGEHHDIHKDMMHITLEIVSKTLFDADVSGEAENVGRALSVVLDNFTKRASSGFLIPPNLPTPSNQRARKAVQQLDEIMYGIISQRRESLAAGQPDPGDLLSMLIQARDDGPDSGQYGEGMSDKQLRDECMTLFLAGHETTAILLSWSWYLLAQHPEVERRLLEELQFTLNGRLPTLEDLPSLKYTSWIVNEALRLYPPAWIIGRQALGDCQIGGYTIPAGSLVLMSQWVTHHDERFYADPLAFKPERWDNDLMKNLPRYAYYPFGGGPRKCIGSDFAMMEAALLMATIAQQYHFELEPGFKPVPWPVITLRPRDGVQVILHKR